MLLSLFLPLVLYSVHPYYCTARRNPEQSGSNNPPNVPQRPTPTQIVGTQIMAYSYPTHCLTLPFQDPMEIINIVGNGDARTHSAANCANACRATQNCRAINYKPSRNDPVLGALAGGCQLFTHGIADFEPESNDGRVFDTAGHCQHYTFVPHQGP